MTLRTAFKQQLQAQKARLEEKQKACITASEKRRIQFYIDELTRRIEALK